MLAVDVDDLADGDDRLTVGARLRVGGRPSFAGHASPTAPENQAKLPNVWSAV